MNKYLKWSGCKLSVDTRITDNIKPRERDVWIIVFGENIGFEENGSGANYTRPGIIIKKFNKEMCWAIPLTTKQKEIDYYYNFTDPQDRMVAAIIPQMRLISTKRCMRKIYKISSVHYLTIKQKVTVYLK